MTKNRPPNKTLQVIHASDRSSGKGRLATDLADLLEQVLQVSDV